MTEEREDNVMEAIATMMHPRSIAVVGATPRLQYGGRFLNNLLETKYAGRVYPINPKYDELMGVRCYPDIASLPEAPDLAGIIVRADRVMEVLEECATKGVKTCVIIAGGFAEIGTEEKKNTQKAMSELAKNTGMRLCGPNCLGIANVKDNIWPCSAVLADILATKTGDLALVSQSGATAFGPFLVRAQDRDIGFSYILSTGNQADLDTSDFIRYCIRQPEVKGVAGYFETIRDADKFRTVAEEALQLHKPIVALKIGRSAAGQRAALSHTASMTGSDQSYDAFFKQLGVIRIEDWDELVETASFLIKTPPFKKQSLGIVAHSGGVASLLADKGEQVMPVPQPSQTTRKGLDDILQGFGSSANPADITWHAFEEEFSDVLNLMLTDDEFGGLVIGTAGTETQAERIIRASEQTDKPVAMLWTGSERNNTGLPLIRRSARVPVFARAENLAKAIRASLEFHKAKDRYEKWTAHGAHSRTSTEDFRLSNADGTLGLMESLDLLSHFGIPVTRGGLARSASEAALVSDRIGYPVVLKVDSPDLPHKTDLGLVKIGLKSKDEVRAAFDELQSKVESMASRAQVNGILVQEMVSGGTEVIVGVKVEPQMGPVLLFGLGGIFTEVMKDISLRVCPVTPDDVQEMIRDVKGFKLLQGYRGAPPADIEALEGALLNTARLAMNLKGQIREIDINPLLVLPKGQGVRAIDALVITGLVE